VGITKKSGKGRSAKNKGDDKMPVRPKGMSLEDFKKYNKSEEAKGGKYKDFRKNHQFTPPPDSTSCVRFMTDGQDAYYYRGFTHEIFSGTKSYREFLCRNDEKGKGDCPACKKGVPRKFFSVCAIYLKWVKDDDQEKIAEYKYGKETRKLKGFKYWSHSRTVMKQIASKIGLKGLKGRDWFVVREGSGMNDTKYSLEGDDLSKFKKKVTSKSLAFFDNYINGLNKSVKEIKAMIKGWEPQESDALPDEDDESEFDDMNRKQLKKFIREYDEEFKFFSSQSDDDLRETAAKLEADTDGDDLEEDDL